MLNSRIIDESRTFDEFAYTSKYLKRGSLDKVWTICLRCGTSHKMPYKSYVHNKAAGCMRCMANNIHWKRGPFNIEYFTAVQESINDGRINELKTFEAFGYYSIDLSPMSGKRVWKICDMCGDEKEIFYFNYTYGKLKCISCVQKGKILSDDHKRKVSENHYDNSGENHPFYGKHHSEESKRKISATSQNITYEEWESYAVDSPYCPAFNEECKESNRDKYDRRCFLCNRLEEDNINKSGDQKKLYVHHVDMNKNQGCDGHVWKLVPLCMYCHGPTHTKKMINYIEYILEDEEIDNE